MLKIHTITDSDIKRAGLPHLYRRSSPGPITVPAVDLVIPGTEEVPIQDADAVLVKAPVGFKMGLEPVVLAVEKLVRLVEFHGIDPQRLVVVDMWSVGELPLILPQDGAFMRSRIAEIESNGIRLTAQQKQTAFESLREKLYAVSDKIKFARKYFTAYELKALGDRAIVIPNINEAEDLLVPGEPHFEVDIAVGGGRGARHVAAVAAIRAWHAKCRIFAPERGLYDDYVARVDEASAKSGIFVNPAQSVALMEELKKQTGKQVFSADVKPEITAADAARARCVLVTEEYAGVAPRALWRAMSSGRAVVWMGSEFPGLPSWIDTTGWLLRIKDADTKNLGRLVRLWLREPGNDARIIEAGKQARAQWELACRWQDRLAETLGAAVK